ncbi:hypothetical protein [Lentzea sp. NPDC051838]|uniref:hypothetical protein n=1 Tax=Lentzea sp. NPDC051838 TaxID=3154849 RepID=UPI0034225B4A
MNDTLRLEIAPAEMLGLQVLVHVNDVERTSVGAGMGRDPVEVLVQDKAFVATEKPHTFVIATCDCGIDGCGRTDVTIVREAGTVRWTWSYEVPMPRDAVFDAEAYDREIARVAEGREWETPVLAAARLVMIGAPKISWAGAHAEDPERFQVILRKGWGRRETRDYSRDGRSPQELAQAVLRELA